MKLVGGTDKESYEIIGKTDWNNRDIFATNNGQAV